MHGLERGAAVLREEERAGICDQQAIWIGRIDEEVERRATRRITGDRAPCGATVGALGDNEAAAREDRTVPGVTNLRIRGKANDGVGIGLQLPVVDDSSRRAEVERVEQLAHVAVDVELTRVMGIEEGAVQRASAAEAGRSPDRGRS